MSRPRMVHITRPAPAAIPPIAAAASPVLVSSSSELLSEEELELEKDPDDVGSELELSAAKVALAFAKGSVVGARVDPISVM